MAQLESFLVDFLAREKFNALMDAVSCRTLDFINAVLMEAGIALQALQMPQQELEKNITIFEQTLKRAESERRLIQDVLEGDKKRVTFFCGGTGARPAAGGRTVFKGHHESRPCLAQLRCVLQGGHSTGLGPKQFPIFCDRRPAHEKFQAVSL
ncbi:MAG: hypothetical protein VR64_20655 [Desulfatitalea sp. BRH_c12]|nr:MAG: hypothetical protein VR64_20655 [Desulfatitalea sp. BRH_c12]